MSLEELRPNDPKNKRIHGENISTMGLADNWYISNYSKDAAKYYKRNKNRSSQKISILQKF